MVASAAGWDAAQPVAGYPCCGAPDHRWADIRPYVVNLTGGEFSRTGEMTTCVHEVDNIFDVYLPAFVCAAEKRSPGRRVPLVIWAHGGIVSESAGLEIAENQVPWWRANDAYPLHFVWETGFLETARRIFRRRASDSLRSDPELRAEAADPSVGPVLDVPEYRGRLTARPWMSLKENAAKASEDGGGARYVAERLAQFCSDYGDRVSLHAAGHSAGAIFHSHFLPAARAVGVPSFDSLQLLAPAIRVDGFRESMLTLVDQDIQRLTVYTMNKQAEEDDTCFRLYRRSLLYLVSRRFEPEPDAPILGLEMSIRADPELTAAFGLNAESPGLAEVIWSPSGPQAPLDSRSSAITHGGFDNDPDTMNSVARRVLGRSEIVGFPAAERGLSWWRRGWH
ncbi:MAG: hypothetical protein ABWZ98_05590 [Nakamurella sp.]